MKKIFDSLHGFIHFDEVEWAFIHHRAFQRLRYIRQLGAAYLVYPGATHSRFEHSIGVMHIATLIFDNLCNDFENRGLYRRLTRLAALAHDLGHLPFSHVAEKLVFGQEGWHEKMTERILNEPSILEILSPLLEECAKNNLDGFLVLKEMATGSAKNNNYFSSMIAHDLFGADRIDYLLRDSKNSGLAYGWFDYKQLIEEICLYEGNILSIKEGGVEACESMLLARYFMYRRIYHHPLIREKSLCLSPIIADFITQKEALDNVDLYLEIDDADILVFVKQLCEKPDHPLYKEALCFMSSSLHEAITPQGIEEEKISLEKPPIMVLGKDGKLYPFDLLSKIYNSGAGDEAKALF